MVSKEARSIWVLDLVARQQPNQLVKYALAAQAPDGKIAARFWPPLTEVKALPQHVKIATAWLLPAIKSKS